MSATTTTATASVRPEQRNARPPKSKLALFFWRPWVWFEATFVLSMLEDWEKIMLLTIFASLFILVCTGLFRFLPHHVSVMRRRAAYYLFGAEGDESSFWQWASNTITGVGATATAKLEL